jgi:hypothetical protein
VISAVPRRIAMFYPVLLRAGNRLMRAVSTVSRQFVGPLRTGLSYPGCSTRGAAEYPAPVLPVNGRVTDGARTRDLLSRATNRWSRHKGRSMRGFGGCDNDLTRADCHATAVWPARPARRQRIGGVRSAHSGRPSHTFLASKRPRRSADRTSWGRGTRLPEASCAAGRGPGPAPRCAPDCQAAPLCGRGTRRPPGIYPPARAGASSRNPRSFASSWPITRIMVPRRGD